jgi:hypothetical protein
VIDEKAEKVKGAEAQVTLINAKKTAFATTAKVKAIGRAMKNVQW